MAILASYHANEIKSVTIAPADDWHHHLRDGAGLVNLTVPNAMRQFKRVIVMPNLKPPVTTTALAIEYRQRIMDAMKQHEVNIFV